MPLPDEQKGESKKDFLERCMGNSTTNKDFPENKQRYAVCNNIWSKKKEESSATVAKIGSDEYIFAEKKKEKNGNKPLNKPFRTPNGPKKFGVYVKNDKGNIVLVRFGDKNMEIKRDDPERRKAFRARHKCDTDRGPKWKSRWWACFTWQSGTSVTDILKGSVHDEVEEWDGETFWDQEELLSEFPELLESEDVEEDQDI
jgi:hypothetical protein